MATIAEKWFAENGSKYPDKGDWSKSTAFWAYVKTLPAAQQQQVLKDGEGKFTPQDKKDAFRNGIQLPGVDKAGNGSGLSKGEIANILTGKGIEGGEKVSAAVSQNPDDYKVKPTLQGDEKPIDFALMTPAQKLELETQDSAINQTRTDRVGRNAQEQALGGYRDIYQQEGLTAIDRARMEQSRAVQQAQARGQEQAIMADAAEQGRGGGNASLLARLQAQQGSTMRMANDDLQTQALALQRRDNAVHGMGQVGGQIQNAQDAIDQFNTLGERDRARDNLNTINQGRTLEWGEQNGRDLANNNTTNQGRLVDYATNAGIHTQNTNRVNAAEDFNKSGSGGARGMARDIAAGEAALLGQYGAAAGLFSQQQEVKDTNDANQQAALYGAVSGALGSGLRAVTGTSTWKNI